jgi:hypothetical protein
MCEPVTSNVLPALREKQEEPFMETEELVREIEMSVIEDEEESPGQYREVINEVVNFLDETGEVSYTGHCIHVQEILLNINVFTSTFYPESLAYMHACHVRRYMNELHLL